jgi:hypothetical protein
MTDQNFIKKNLFICPLDDYIAIAVYIYAPIELSNGLFQSYVKFQDIEEYSKNIKGFDEFNAIECAVAYVNSICVNSCDPKFFNSDKELMYRDVV